MVQCLENPDNSGCSIIIMPHQAMPWRDLMLVFSLIAVIALAVAVPLYKVGLTLVLPYSGIGLVALGIALYVSAWRSVSREVIRITCSRVIIESGHYALEHKHVLKRDWSKAVLQAPRNSWYPRHLLIRSHGRQIEVGKFLDEQERQTLARELQKKLSFFVRLTE